MADNVNVQDSDMFFVQRTSTRDSVNLKLYGSQLRNYIEQTQLNLNTEIVGEFKDLQDVVAQNTADISAIIEVPDGLIATLDTKIQGQITDLVDVDTDIKSDIGKLYERIQRLEEYSDIKGFYYIQPSSEFATSKKTMMVFNDPEEDKVTKIRINKEDVTGTTFSFLNVVKEDKIEIIKFDGNNIMRKRLLYNITTVGLNSVNDYVELDVEYLFSTGTQPLSDFIGDGDGDEVRIELFPAWDASSAVTQDYVDNRVDNLESELTSQISVVKGMAGVSKIVGLDGIQITSKGGSEVGTGEVSIKAIPVIQQYDLPPAKSTELGGVKITTLSGPLHSVVGINSDDKLVVQESTNNKRGVNIKGQCCVASGSVPNTSDYSQGQIIWHTGKKVLYLVT